MKVSLDWLKDYISFKDSAEDLCEKLTMAGLEVKGKETFQKDQVLEIEITSNRPDWLSYVGVAREVAALSGKTIRFPEWENKGPRETKRSLQVEIEDLKRCSYYSCCLLEDVECGESPEFIKNRLLAVGMRPINLIVDVTNYVLLEMGQPLHAFDWDKIGHEKIGVRLAREGEKMTAINGTEYTLKKEDLLITDGRHPIALAGVMGGVESEVNSRTRNVLLESAYFAPASVRRTSKRLVLTSDSSYRFERGVNPEGVDQGRERAIYLIRKYGKIGKIGPVIKSGKPPIKKKIVFFPLTEVKRILGLDLPAAKVISYLRPLGLGIKQKKKGVLAVQIPPFRQDISRPVDLVEEIARLHGYERITDTIPTMRPMVAVANRHLNIEKTVRETALGLGFNEAITFSLISEKLFSKLGLPVAGTRIVNPQNKELTLMRPTLFPSLIEVVKTNFYRGHQGVALFEVANVYGVEVNKQLPPEQLTFGWAVSGMTPLHWSEKSRKYSFYDLKGVLEEVAVQLGLGALSFVETQNVLLEEAYSVLLNGKPLGCIGKVSAAVRQFFDIQPDVFIGEVSLDPLSAEASVDRKYKPLPKFPSSKRDLAVVLAQSVHGEEVVRTIAAVNPAWIKKVELMDVYRGGQIPPGKKSLAFSIEYRAEDHTLTAEEINHLHSGVIGSVTSRFEAELRS